MTEGTSSPDLIESKSASLPEIQQKAVKKFGITSDPQEARYILSDGTFLRMTHGNYKEHGGIVELYPGKTSDRAVQEFMASGVIRFSRRGNKTGEQAYAEFRGVPNDKQIISLMRATKDVNQLALEMSGPNGSIISEVYQFHRGLDIHRFIQRAKELMTEKNLKAA